MAVFIRHILVGIRQHFGKYHRCVRFDFQPAGDFRIGIYGCKQLVISYSCNTVMGFDFLIERHFFEKIDRILVQPGKQVAGQIGNRENKRFFAEKKEPFDAIQSHVRPDFQVAGGRLKSIDLFDPQQRNFKIGLVIAEVLQKTVIAQAFTPQGRSRNESALALRTVEITVVDQVEYGFFYRTDADLVLFGQLSLCWNAVTRNPMVVLDLLF